MKLVLVPYWLPRNADTKCDQDFKKEPKTGFYNAPVMSRNAPMHFDFL